MAIDPTLPATAPGPNPVIPASPVAASPAATTPAATPASPAPGAPAPAVDATTPQQQPPAPVDPVATYETMAHLLRRTGFGATPEEIRIATEQGIAAVTDRLVNYEQVHDPIVDDPFLVNYIELFIDDTGHYRDKPLPITTVRNWWIYRMLATKRPLEERMVLFWHNHWTSSDPEEGDLMLRQNRLFRKYALGNFREMAQQVSKDAEMVRYLNGDRNYKAHPNENYARELMELFTCGRVDANGKPNYTENDVKAGARAFSGWNTQADYVFHFDPNQHDNGPKTFMGQTGNFNGDQIVDILVQMPATANYLCHKLFRYLAYDNPSQATIDKLTDIYFKSGYEVRPIVEAILTSDEFYSPRARNAVIKSPAEFVLGTIKMTGMAPYVAPPVDQDTMQTMPDDPDEVGNGLDGVKLHYGKAKDILAGINFIADAMHRMGQDLLSPPSVKGWDGGTRWYNVNTIQARARFALAYSNDPRLRLAERSGLNEPETELKTVPIDAHPAISDPPRLIDALLWQFGPLDVSNRVRSILLNVAAHENDPGIRIRTLLALVLSTPEYQSA